MMTMMMVMVMMVLMMMTGIIMMMMVMMTMMMNMRRRICIQGSVFDHHYQNHDLDRIIIMIIIIIMAVNENVHACTFGPKVPLLYLLQVLALVQPKLDHILKQLAMFLLR